MEIDQMKTILDSDHDKAREFFLKSDNYFNTKLPSYFNFTNILKEVSDRLELKISEDLELEMFEGSYKENLKLHKKNLRSYKEKLLSFYGETNPKKFEGVNHKLFIQKNSPYVWRMIQLVHPVIYVVLVNFITKKQNWEAIQKRFESFKEEKIECFSIPGIKNTERVQISNWWHEIEQKSVKLSLEYEHMYSLDIANFYDTIYTHAVTWALCGREETKKIINGNSCDISEESKKFYFLGDVIDNLLQQMSYGQTNGISQGNAMSDFIAEMILGYIDKELSKKIIESEKKIDSEETVDGKIKITDYRILRYRDDYRIFFNNSQDAERIKKFLVEVLGIFNFNLNDSKTKKSDNILKDSIKPDKLDFILTNNFYSAKSLTKKLYVIRDIAEKHPNSGSVAKSLNDFSKVLESTKKVGLGSVKEKLIEFLEMIKNIKKINEKYDDIEVMISLVLDIVLKNSRTLRIGISVLADLINLLDSKNKEEIIIKIRKKLDKIPHTGYMEVWFQRLIISVRTEEEIGHEESLCKVVKNALGDEETDSCELWNSEWLKENIKELVKTTSIIKEEELDEAKENPDIPRKEFDPFHSYND